MTQADQRSNSATTQHTQGPWEAFEILDGIAIRDSRNATVACCDYSTEGDATELPEAETEANARLIKAAPELLAALRYCDMALADLEAAKCKGYIAHAIKLTRAALGKVKGGA